MNPRFQTFLDAVRMPVFILIIIAAIFIDYADRSYFESAFVAAPAPAPGAQQPSAPAAQASSTAPSLAQPSAQISIDDTSALPTSVTTGQIVSFSFTIQNTTGMAASFPYKVYVDWNTGEEDVIDENILTLAAGESRSIPEELKFEQASDKGEIFIKLQNTGQTVQFALPVQ